MMKNKMRKYFAADTKSPLVIDWFADRQSAG